MGSVIELHEGDWHLPPVGLSNQAAADEVPVRSTVPAERVVKDFAKQDEGRVAAFEIDGVKVGTVAREPAPFPSLLPPMLDSAGKRDRVQLAHVAMLKQASVLLAAIDDMTRKGFVPLGFTAHLEDGLTVMVEPPQDEQVRRRQDLAVCCVRGHNYLWFMHGGVRIAWQFTVPAPEAA